MLAPFFTLAAQSPTRQRTFRRAVAIHLLVLTGVAWSLWPTPGASAEALGQTLLIAGIVEGAALIGWRLTQLPKSQALEFLLVSPLRPHRLFLGEAAVGLAQLALLTLSGLPVLLLLVLNGNLNPYDPLPLLLIPLVGGAATGLGLTMWAYEVEWVRRIGERLLLGLVVVYLIVGVLAGENLVLWLQRLPPDLGRRLYDAARAFHEQNPFGVVRFWFSVRPVLGWEPVARLLAIGLGVVLLLLLRGAWRLEGHFQEFHYQPVADVRRQQRPAVGERPLAWWAVKRVARFSGRINLWLAGGFCALYAAFLLAGDSWPAWLGRRIFEMCDAAGGVEMLTTGLVLLAAVPAAFQYGLWDSNNQDRCRRLELLLLTDLGPADYWEAAVAAAWRRGRGYFAVAALLWGAALISGRLSAGQVAGSVAGGVLLWSLYFALGFRAFSRGLHTNGLGVLLTVGLPVLAYVLVRLDLPTLAALLPPGLVFAAGSGSWPGLVSAVVAGGVALGVARHALHHADTELRAWYDRHAGAKVMT
jgi:hypothetical protein